MVYSNKHCPYLDRRPWQKKNTYASPSLYIVGFHTSQIMCVAAKSYVYTIALLACFLWNRWGTPLLIIYTIRPKNRKIVVTPKNKEIKKKGKNKKDYNRASSHSLIAGLSLTFALRIIWANPFLKCFRQLSKRGCLPLKMK